MSVPLNPVVAKADVLEARIYRTDDGDIAVEAKIQSYGEPHPITPAVAINEIPAFTLGMDLEDIMWRIANVIAKTHHS
ncbi:hypothetical protein [Candidatus Palauibacter sp.]|uniref:hypothetical protein n=1 Tax=Candidatus Palauibacter sp. TaxID=3101350 RepID=UPI003B5928C9